VSRVGPRAPVVTGLMPTRSLSDLIWVANTRHGPAGHWFARVTRDDGDHDHLLTAQAARSYLADHSVEVPDAEPTDADLRALATIREMARALRNPDAGWTSDVRSILEATRFRVDEHGQITADGSGWGAFSGDLMLTLIKLVDLRDRLKICGNPLCRLMYLDLSKNQTRLWCDDAGCGNRFRLRQFRSRAAARLQDQPQVGTVVRPADSTKATERPHHAHPSPKAAETDRAKGPKGGVGAQEPDSAEL
jgi:CGNR zinc finger